ncbi:MAG: hypothetical protein H8K03_22120 (plasmid) [Nitrospira sp.]
MSRVMPIKHLPTNRSVSVAARVASAVAIGCLVAAGILECSERSYQLFMASHDAIRPGMTMGEVFGSGLADYMVDMGVKNVPGATQPENQPASAACKRHVLDVTYVAGFPASPVFRIRLYCNMNEPSAGQVIPEHSFKTKQEFLEALDSMYASWAKYMEFRIESPPLEAFGAYDHYLFTTDQQGRVATVSPILLAQSKKQQ